MRFDSIRLKDEIVSIKPAVSTKKVMNQVASFGEALAELDTTSISKAARLISKYAIERLPVKAMALFIPEDRKVVISSLVKFDEAEIEIIKINLVKTFGGAREFVGIKVENFTLSEGDRKGLDIKYMILREGVEDVGALAVAFEEKLARVVNDLIPIIALMVGNTLGRIKSGLEFKRMSSKYYKLVHNLPAFRSLINDEAPDFVGKVLDVLIREFKFDGVAFSLPNAEEVYKRGKVEVEDKFFRAVEQIVMFEQKAVVIVDNSLDLKDVEYDWIKLDLSNYAEDGLMSCMVLPISDKGLLVIFNEHSLFEEEDVMTLSLVRDILNQKINHISQIDEKERLLKERTSLNEIVKYISVAGRSLDSIVKKILTKLLSIMDSDMSGIFLANTGLSQLHIVSQNIPTPSQIEFLKELVADIYGMIALREVVPEEILVEMSVLKKRGIYEGDISSYVAVPVFANGEIKGLVLVASFKEGAFSSFDVSIVSSFALQLGIAMESAKVYRGLEEKIRELAFLYDVSKTVGSTLDLEKVLEFIAVLSVQALEAHSSLVWLAEDEKRQEIKVKAVYGVPDYFKRFKFRSGEGIAGSVFATGKTEVIKNVFEDERFRERAVAKQFGLVSMIAVPLSVRGKTIGVLQVFTDRVHHFGDEEISLLESFASQAAVSIENAVLYKDLEQAYLSTVSALAAAIDAKDAYTHGHSSRVMEYAVLIAREMGLPEDEIERIKLAGLLHDIGKIGVRESILLKKGKLTDEEYEEIKKHPVLGANIINQVRFLESVVPYTYYHHERWDGKGYPEGLKGEEIPLGARILAVADTFDAMTSSRSYRKALPDSYALEEIKKNAGKQFDPKVVEAFERVYNKLKILYPEVPLRDVVEGLEGVSVIKG